jgi:NAD(P)H-dependent FMN reductase
MLSYNARPMDQLAVVAVSTREGRQGFPIAEWFVERAKAHGKFEVTLLDLQKINLPMFDEPTHPRFKKYEHAHTKAWSAMVEAADAFVFVTPEYNYSAPPSFTNALDYVYQEWQYKVGAFVSYGGPSGGARAVQVERTHLAAMKVMPIPEAVVIPYFLKEIENGRFKGEPHEKAATAVLDELVKWNSALKPLRAR